MREAPRCCYRARGDNGERELKPCIFATFKIPHQPNEEEGGVSLDKAGFYSWGLPGFDPTALLLSRFRI